MNKTYTGYRGGAIVYRNATAEQVAQSSNYPAERGVKWVEDESDDLPEYAAKAEPTRKKGKQAEQVEQPADEAEQGA